MRCHARPKVWGLFPRGHEWRRITSPFVIEPDDGAIDLGVKVLVGAICEHCGETGLVELGGGWSVQHIHRSLDRDPPVNDWWRDEGVVTTRAKALDFIHRLVGDAPA